ncbi:hypothetical protein V8B97DRAFT_1913636 [Scleroderma yunnanense]
MNSTLNNLASRVVESNRARDEIGDGDDAVDAIFAELEAEIENDDNASLRERGLGHLRRQASELKHMQENAYGTYSEITDEKEAIRSSQVIKKLAPKYFATRFLRVFVENVPWLVQRLAIKVLPCVICFIDGVMKDRLIGFEELGNSDAFETAALELRLSQSGVLQKAVDQFGALSYTVQSGKGRNQTSEGDDDVFDLDD